MRGEGGEGERAGGGAGWPACRGETCKRGPFGATVRDDRCRASHVSLDDGRRTPHTSTRTTDGSLCKDRPWTPRPPT